jgi:NAD(P)-dependent dehydrogenase (short-subunit alcohol dehydrogenase family)
MFFFQPKVPPIPSSTDLSGKTIIITGSNSGIGLEAAREFLRLKASRVILAVRNLAKGEAAAAEIRPVNPDAEVKVMHLDLDTYDSVVAFANQVKHDLTELHVVVLNAGLNAYTHATSASGHEQILQVNFLSHAVLALELLPLLRSTAAKEGSPTRLSFVSSFITYKHTLTQNPIGPDESIIAHIDDPANFVSGIQYADTKLAINAFVAELARRFPLNEDGKVIVNAICPGFVDTGFDDTMPWFIRYPTVLLRWISGRRVEDGGRTLVHAGLAGEETHGEFLEHGAEVSK